MRGLSDWTKRMPAGFRLSRTESERRHAEYMSYSTPLFRPALVASLVWLASFVACRDAEPPQAPEPAEPAEVRVADGNRQVALAGHPLPSPIVAKVVDAAGEPMSGVEVLWHVDEGTLRPGYSLTDAEGQARSIWTLGQTEGEVAARAEIPGAAPAVFTAVAEPPNTLPLDELRPLPISTYDGSGQVVHPDYAASPEGPAAPVHLAITPYPFGNAAWENPSLFVGGSMDRWQLAAGARNPVARPILGYLSDPDLVYLPETRELWLYYRQVTTHNIVQLIRSADGVIWSAPAELVRVPNHGLISPSVVRRSPNDWWMWSVDAGTDGCGAAATSVELRRSTDGVQWADPVTVDLVQPGYSPWHIDVQWIPSRHEFWAVYNGKTPGSCTTPAVFLATSPDGVTWRAQEWPVLAKGRVPQFDDIVYRTTFDYDPVTDAITFWYSGARYNGTQYVWSAAVERRRRSDVFAPSLAATGPFPPAPAPLVEWP
jgi:hypothetical protein